MSIGGNKPKRIREPDSAFYTAVLVLITWIILLQVSVLARKAF